MTIRVALVDDQQLIRAGFRMVVDSQEDMEVVAEAGDGDAALRALDAADADVVLMDVRMPGTDGIAACAALTEASDVRVIILTTFDLDEYVYGALRGGAVGFILKDAGPSLLAEAVRAASAGDALISPSITLRLLHHLRDVRQAPTGGPARPLSKRETEVVRAVARGRTNQEIAAELFISLSTVKTHVAGIQAKLGVRNRVGIAAWAWENHIMTAT
jgi:DNA-binding NarL/FixJ family response regulator